MPAAIFTAASVAFTTMPSTASRAPDSSLADVTVFVVSGTARHGRSAMRNVSAIVIQRHGPPAEAARVEPVALPDPQPHEALVRMLAAPINPADLNLIEGKYGIRPELPAVMGIEGAGRVEEIGSAVTNLKPGALVLMPTRAGAWREASVVAANDLIAVPEGIAPEQAAMMRSKNSAGRAARPFSTTTISAPRSSAQRTARRSAWR